MISFFIMVILYRGHHLLGHSLLLIFFVHSGSTDHVFVYFADHGGPDLIAFPDGEVSISMRNFEFPPPPSQKLTGFHVANQNLINEMKSIVSMKSCSLTLQI